MKKTHRQNSSINRRKFMQIIAIAGATGICWRYGIDKISDGYHVVRRSQPMMGTTLNLTVCGPDRDATESAVNSTIARMLYLEKRLSRHQPDSEVSQLNNDGIISKASHDFRKILTLARFISEKTDGSFDITTLPLINLHKRFIGHNFVPDKAAVADARTLVDYRKIKINAQQVTLTKPGMKITLDGIGKGHIVDQGVATLSQAGFPNVLVEAGGDLITSGHKRKGEPWLIGIQNPRPHHEQKLITIQSGNHAVATSGDYMQPYSQDLLHHHIVNPITGFSPPELASCTIIAPTAAMADGLATGAMVLGARKSIDLLETMPNCEGYFIAKDLETYKTTGFPILT